MRWPFMLRSTHDARMASMKEVRELGMRALREMVDETVAGLAAERARFDALLDRYHALVMQQTAPAPAPEPMAPPPPAGPKRPAKVQAALDAASAGLPRALKTAMIGEVDRMLAENVPEATIVQKTLRGEEVGI